MAGFGGARLIIQRAVEDEFDAWLGRARYERRPDYQRGFRNYDSGLRNGFRPRKVQTLEGELQVEIPQVREAAEPFVSKLFPCSTKILRTEPLRAMVIGAFVRGLSMRDIESPCEKAGLWKLSKTTAQRPCEEPRERFEQLGRRDLYDVRVAALFLDAVFLSVRPGGAKEDWLELGRDLTSRGLAAPRLVVAEGAPGLTGAVEEIWPRANRQHCAVHRLRNLQAKLPKSQQDRIRFNYWSALTDATSVKDGKLRLQVLISELEHAGYDAAARCLDALVVHLRYPLRHRERSNGATFTDVDRHHLYRIKYHLSPRRIYSGKESAPSVWRLLIE